MERIILANHGPQKDTVAKAFGVTVKQAVAKGIEQVVLVVPHKGAFPTTVVGEFIGEKNAKLMAKGTALDLGGVKFVCESPGTLQKVGRPKAVLATYVAEKDMLTVDGLTGLDFIIYLPWMGEDGEAWQKKWNAIVVGETRPAHEPQIPEGLLGRLRDLTATINLSTGLSHPLDEKKAKTMFKLAKEELVAIDPAAIEVWAARNGWSPKDAEGLRRLAERYV